MRVRRERRPAPRAPLRSPALPPQRAVGGGHRSASRALSAAGVLGAIQGGGRGGTAGAPPPRRRRLVGSAERRHTPAPPRPAPRPAPAAPRSGRRRAPPPPAALEPLGAPQAARHLPRFLLDRPRLPLIARLIARRNIAIASIGRRAPIAATLRATRLVCGVGAAARRGGGLWLSHAEVLGQPGVRLPCARARSPRRWCTAPPYRSSDQRARGQGRGRARARATCERDVAVFPGAPRRREHLAIVLLPSPPSAAATVFVFRTALLPRHMPRLACGDPRLGRAGPRASGGLFTRFEDPRAEKGGTTCHLSVGKVHASPSPPDSWSGFDHRRVPNFCPTALSQCHRGFALEVGAHPLTPLLCAIMFPCCRSYRT